MLFGTMAAEFYGVIGDFSPFFQTAVCGAALCNNLENEDNVEKIAELMGEIRKIMEDDLNG